MLSSPHRNPPPQGDPHESLRPRRAALLAVPAAFLLALIPGTASAYPNPGTRHRRHRHPRPHDDPHLGRPLPALRHRRRPRLPHLHRPHRVQRAAATPSPPGRAGGRRTPTEAWAPDISYQGGKYLMYYAVSTFGSNKSAIGLADFEHRPARLLDRPGHRLHLHHLQRLQRHRPEPLRRRRRQVVAVLRQLVDGHQDDPDQPVHRQAALLQHHPVLDRLPPHRDQGRRGALHRQAERLLLPLRLLRHLLRRHQLDLQGQGRPRHQRHRAVRRQERRRHDEQRRHPGPGVARQRTSAPAASRS